MRKSIFDTNWFRNFYFLLIFVLVVFLSRFHPELVDKSNYRIQDFAYYLELTKYWWRNPGNIYQLDYQIQVYSHLFGVVIDRPMPVMWSPTTLVVFSPFVLLDYINVEIAHVVWVALSIVVTLYALSHFKEKYAPIFSTLFLTPIALNSAIFGQISILACGIYCLFICGFFKNKNFWQLLSLCILAIKPTFLAPAFVILLARRQFAVLATFTLLLIGWFIYAEVRSGLGLITSYVDVLSMFSNEVIKAPYNLSFDPDINVNSLMFLKPFLGWNISYSISVLSFFVSQLLAVALAIFSKSVIRPQQAFFVSMSSYLLFSPYLGWYEELLLIPLVGFSLFYIQKTNKLLKILILLALTIILFRPIEVTPVMLNVYFIIRVILLLLLAYCFKPSRQAVVGSNSSN